MRRRRLLLLLRRRRRRRHATLLRLSGRATRVPLSLPRVASVPRLPSSRTHLPSLSLSRLIPLSCLVPPSLTLASEPEQGFPSQLFIQRENQRRDAGRERQQERSGRRRERLAIKNSRLASQSHAHTHSSLASLSLASRRGYINHARDARCSRVAANNKRSDSRDDAGHPGTSGWRRQRVAQERQQQRRRRKPHSFSISSRRTDCQVDSPSPSSVCGSSLEAKCWGQDCLRRDMLTRQSRHGSATAG